jgi:hypothetical protein
LDSRSENITPNDARSILMFKPRQIDANFTRLRI